MVTIGEIVGNSYVRSEKERKRELEKGFGPFPYGAYIAARYERKHEMREFASQLQQIGILVTSSWLHEPDYTPDELLHLSSAVMRGYAEDDLRDIASASVFIYFTEETPSIRGGRHVECGYAMGLKKPILVVGKPENIFCHLNRVRLFDGKEEVLQWIQNLS